MELTPAEGGTPIPSGLGRTTPPPLAGGGRVAIRSRMKLIAHHLTHWPVGVHVHKASEWHMKWVKIKRKRKVVVPMLLLLFLFRKY